MDLWVFVAAVGAGYLTKYWQNLPRNSDYSPQLASGVPNAGSSSSPIRGYELRKKLDKDVSVNKRASDGKILDLNSLDGLSLVEGASVDGGKKVRGYGNYDDENVLSEPNSAPLSSPNENLEEVGDRNSEKSYAGNNIVFLLPESSTREVGCSPHSSGNRTYLRTKLSHRKFIRSLNSTESCLMAQLYKEHAEMVEYVFTYLPSSSTPAMRPFFVSDGNRIFNGENSDSICTGIEREETQMHGKAFRERSEDAFAFPSLPKLGLLELPKKMEPMIGKKKRKRITTSTNTSGTKHLHSHWGSPGGPLLFCLGISIGIIFSIMANKREKDKLKAKLKQTDNLVHDLQEELEMKDSMTLKDLGNVNYELADTCDNSFYERATCSISQEKQLDNFPKNGCEEPYDQQEEMSLESLSKIEAELEAELEILGLNMKRSSLDKRYSNFSEIDSDFSEDFVQGELKADMMSGEADLQPRSDEDIHGGLSTPPSANYAVSPLDLSLRLHEVIESRLKERVKELEIALQNSQRKVHLMETAHENYLRSFGSISPSIRENQVTKECGSRIQPLVMHLSGEALDAYTEAYEELVKMSESEEYSPSAFNDHDYEMDFHSNDWRVFGGHDGAANGPSTCMRAGTEKHLPEIFYDEDKTWGGQSSSIHDLNDLVSGDEKSDCDDEMDRQLINQIVQRTKNLYFE